MLFMLNKINIKMNTTARKDTISSSEQESETNPNIATVKFQCQFETNFGQQLHIIGNIEELGSWNEEKAPMMLTDKDTYPIWECPIEITCPVGMTIEYRYLVRLENGTTVYESQQKRSITMKKGGSFIILNKKEDNTIKIKGYNGLGRGDVDGGIKNIVNQKTSFDSTSDIVSSQKPIELIAYENNQMNCDVMMESIDFSLNQKISSKDRVIYVSNYLPVIVEKDKDGQYKLKPIENGSVMNTLNMLKMNKKLNFLWVGMLMNYFDFSTDEIDEVDMFLQDNDYYMIYPKKEDWDKFIIFTDKIVFPIFVDSTFDSEDEYLSDYDVYFDAFHAVNKKYAETIGVIMQEKDFVIINDIYLALVPNGIMTKNNNASIGIFIHSPLPASDVVKTFPKYQEIIKSILLCDVIGFHLFAAARNFMTILKRFFGLFPEISKKGMCSVSFLGRTIIIHIKQGQIDLDYIQSLQKANEFKEQEEKYKQIIGDKFSIISLDHIDLVQAIATKFRMIDLFFSRNPQLIDKVIFIILIKQFKDQRKESIKQQFNVLLNKLFTKYNTDKFIHIEYVENYDYGLYQRLSLFKLCNILLYPVYFEGHCIYAHEFISMQRADKKYSLILGENVCASIGFKSVIKSNLYNPEYIVQKIKEIYDSKISKMKFNNDLAYLKKNSTVKWVTDFILDMKRVQFHDSKNKIGIGMGLKFQIIKLNTKFKHLSSTKLLKYYSKSNCRVFFLDYENTLIDMDETIAENPLYSSTPIKKNDPAHQRLVKILNNISKKESNLVFILSKYDKSVISKIFSNLPNVGLCAENGFYYKYPNQDKFSQLVNITDWSWKDTVLSILKVFTEKTEESYIVEKDSCISWVYKNCDSYFGHLQGNELKTHLQSIFNNFDIVNDGSCINIKPKNVNKAAFIAEILQREFKKKNIDFIFYVGDDNTDEEAFNYLKSAMKFFPNFNSDIKVFTSTIGKKPSNAKYYFNEVNDCIENLELLAHFEVGKKAKASMSCTSLSDRFKMDNEFKKKLTLSDKKLPVEFV